MKKIAFVLSILCFLTVLNVSAQIVIPGEKTTDSPQNVGKQAETKLSKADLRIAMRKASANPNMITQKKGKETIFLRKEVDPATGRQIYTRVSYAPQSGEFVEYIKGPGDGTKKSESIKRNPDKPTLQPERN